MSRAAKALRLILESGPRGALRRLRRRAAFSLEKAARVPVPPVVKEDVSFSLLVPLYNTPEKFLREMLDSVLAQTYSRWELCLCDGSTDPGPERVVRTYADPRIRYRRLEKNGGISENTNACAAMATGDYFALLDHDDRLHPYALALIACEIQKSGAEFLYSDEASFVSYGPLKLLSFHYKPDFSPDNLRANNYVCHFSVFRRALWEKAGPFDSAFDGSQDHDLILRLTARTKAIAHLSCALYFWRSHAGSVAQDIGAKPYVVAAAAAAVKRAVQSEDGRSAEVESTPVHPTIFRVRYPAVRHTVRVLATDCPPLSFPCVTRVSGPEEFASAAEKAGEDYLLFLRSVRPHEGLEDELLSLAARENVGAVGGTVRDENGRLCDGGKLIVSGRAVTEHYLVPADEPGYMGRLWYAHNVSAVSARCLLVRRELFLSYWQEGFTLTELCLALQKAGYVNITDPYAVLDALSPCPAAEAVSDPTYQDPYFNPNFDPAAADFRIR